MSSERQRPAMFANMIIGVNHTSAIANIEYEKKALHEAVEVKYFYAGSSTLIIGDKVITAQAGDLIIINPYEFHATIGNGEKKGQYHIALIPLECFSGETLDGSDLTDLLLEKRMSFQTLVKASPPVKKAFLRIANEYTQKQPFHHTFIRSLVLELTGLMLREGLCQQNTGVDAGDTLRSYQAVEPALRYIRDAYAENISVEHLAALCRLSKCYFCRLFKTVIGRTAMEYLREYRIRVACSLLENSEKSIADIAVNCGFADYNYFCRCFRQYCGVSPGKYREASRKK